MYSIISELLIDRWNIKSKNCVELKKGSARCFVVSSEDERYFLKLYQDKFDWEKINNEILVCNYLCKRGYHVSEFIIDRDGRYIERINDRLCTLQKYIDGVTYYKFELIKKQLFESVKSLANINIALEELPISLPLRFDSQSFVEWSSKMVIESYSNLLMKLDMQDKYYDKIANDFEKKKEMIDLFNPNLFPFDSLTFANSHGDYNVLQLIFGGSKVKAIIDFSSCARLPVCWEIIRSYSLSSAECGKRIIDMDNFTEYVKVYLKIKKLKKEDLELMPFFYLFSLLKSSFGYNNYIEKREKDILINDRDEETLKFAFWRTDMAKWLFDNSEYLSLKLKNI